MALLGRLLRPEGLSFCGDAANLVKYSALLIGRNEALLRSSQAANCIRRFTFFQAPLYDNKSLVRKMCESQVGRLGSSVNFGSCLQPGISLQRSPAVVHASRNFHSVVDDPHNANNKKQNDVEIMVQKEVGNIVKNDIGIIVQKEVENKEKNDVGKKVKKRQKNKVKRSQKNKVQKRRRIKARKGGNGIGNVQVGYAKIIILKNQGAQIVTIHVIITLAKPRKKGRLRFTRNIGHHTRGSARSAFKHCMKFLKSKKKNAEALGLLKKCDIRFDCNQYVQDRGCELPIAMAILFTVRNRKSPRGMLFLARITKSGTLGPMKKMREVIDAARELGAKVVVVSTKSGLGESTSGLRIIALERFDDACEIAFPKK